MYVVRMQLAEAGHAAVSMARRAGVELEAVVEVGRAGLLGVGSPPTMLRMARSLMRFGLTAGIVALTAARFGDRVALVDERGVLTYSELDARSNAFANALRARGLRPGVTVGLLCRNHRGFLDAFFGSGKLGARTVLLNTDFAAPQLRDVCEREGVELIVHDDEFSELTEGCPVVHGRLLAWVDGPSDGETLEDVLADADRAAPPSPRPKQSIVTLTSGTTGTPKGAARHLGYSMSIPAGLLSKIPYRGSDTVLVAAPFFHAWGLLNLTIALGLGATVVTCRRADPAGLLRQLGDSECTALATVPMTLARVLAEHEKGAGGDLSRLRIIASAGAPLTAELAGRVRARFGDVLHNLYGSTEVAYAAIATPTDLREAPGCVGRPPRGVTVKVLDDEGREVARGETGRIFVANGVQFGGYTGGGGKEIVDGLMSSGDVGRVDVDGRLFVEGRDDDMIVSGGENVYPAEVEALLVCHGDIDDAAVLGVDDQEFGSRLVAFVVARSGSGLAAETVTEFVRSNLARFKVPREVVFVDELPHNPAGKVLKRELARRRPGTNGAV